MSKKVLHIPIEIKPREMYSRLLLAVEAIKNGYIVSIGTMEEVLKLAIEMKSGIYFDKALNQSQYPNIELLKKNNVNVVGVFEEGLSSENYSNLFYKFGISEKSISIADIYFSWGPFEANSILKKYPNFSNKIKIVGNPRMDLALLAKKLNVFKIAPYFKDDYVLLISNFGNNNANGLGFLRKQMQHYGNYKKGNEFSIEFDERITYRYLSMFGVTSGYVKLIKNNPNLKFILRPHPSENLDYWKDILSMFNNVEVIYDDHYEAAIANAKIVIHSSCTSGIFTNLMQVPTISFVPVEDDPYAHFFTNNIGEKTTNEKDLLETFNKLIQSNFDSTYFERNFTKSRSSDFLEYSMSETSVSKIVHNLNNIRYIGEHWQLDNIKKLREVAKKPQYHKLWNNRISNFIYSKIKTPTAKNQLFKNDVGLNYSKVYNKQTFSGIEYSELENFINDLKGIGFIDFEIDIIQLENSYCTFLLQRKN